MGMSIKEAIERIKSGEADEYLTRFVSAVQAAVWSGNSAAISLDDALVASLVLTRLVDTTEGRKLLKKPKRKNTQYKAEDFSRQSPQMKVAREVVDGKFNYPEGLEALETSFDGGRIPDRERTLKRLLDDLIVREEKFREVMAYNLRMAGWDGSDETKEAAAKRLMSNIGFPVPGSTK